MRSHKKKVSTFHKHRGRHIRYALKNPLTYLYILIFVVMAIATAFVFRSETQTESGIETVFDSVWFTLVTVLAGYFDYCVQSVPGRVSALILLALGMVILSVITGKIASVFMDAQMKTDKGMRKLKKMKGHFIICGWRNGFEKIIETVLITNPDITPDMVVLVNEAPSESIEHLRNDIRFKELNYVSGDFSDETVLERAQIETADRALIIADYSKKYSNLEIDSRTVLAVLTMKNLNPSIYVSAELLDEKFASHVELAHCDEVILTQDYEYSLLATASSGMGYSNVIRTLISDDADTGILISDIPSSFVGRTYGEYNEYLRKNGYPGGILVGLLLNTGNFHQRRKDALREAHKNPDVKKVINNLRKIKTLKSNEPLLTPPENYPIQRYTKAILVKGKEIDMSEAE